MLRKSPDGWPILFDDWLILFDRNRQVPVIESTSGVVLDKSSGFIPVGVQKGAQLVISYFETIIFTPGIFTCDEQFVPYRNPSYRFLYLAA